MTHKEWASQMKAAIRLQSSDPRRAVAAIRALSKAAQREARQGITDWHVEQGLGIAATILSEVGAHTDAAALFHRLSSEYRAQLQYYGHAVANALAVEALELSQARQRTRAARVGAEALQYFELFPEQSAVRQQLEELLGPPRTPLTPARSKRVTRTNGAGA